MIRIEGDKPNLYQWDLNQRVILSSIANISAGIEVHFSNEQNKGENALIAPSYKDGNNMYADIPNVLLQTSGIVSVYIYIAGQNKAWTEYHIEILVLPRNKPLNYVYTETEVWSYKELEGRVKTLEENENSEVELPAVSEEDNGKVLAVVDGVWTAVEMKATSETEYEEYAGSYTVVPDATEQVLETAQKYLKENITIQEIPYAEVSNNSGGITVTIAKLEV